MSKVDAAKVREERLRGAFHKTIDRSIDGIQESVLNECFGDELMSSLGNSIPGEFMNIFGGAKVKMEVYNYHLCLYFLIIFS